MASLIPRLVKGDVVQGWIDQTLKIMLLNSTHVPNAVTQQYISDIVANQITDAGGIYTAGGVAIAGKAKVAHGNNYYLDATDKVIGPGASLNYRYVILFIDTGNQATSKILAQIEFTEDQVVVNGTSTIRWNALGIIYIT